MQVSQSLIQAFLVLACWAPFSSASNPDRCTDADLLLRNGHIVTMQTQQTVTSIAVRDGKVLAVGSDQELASCVGARTEIVDLQQRTVLPGLIDVHTHAMEWTRGD